MFELIQLGFRVTMILENRNNRGPGPEGSLLTHARERRAAHVGHFHRLLFWQPMKKEERIFRLEITSTTFELSPPPPLRISTGPTGFSPSPQWENKRPVSNTCWPILVFSPPKQSATFRQLVNIRYWHWHWLISENIRRWWSTRGPAAYSVYRYTLYYCVMNWWCVVVAAVRQNETLDTQYVGWWTGSVCSRGGRGISCWIIKKEEQIRRVTDGSIAWAICQRHLLSSDGNCKLTTLTKSWKVMADVRRGRSSSWLSSNPSSCKWNFSSSCWILCGSTCWRNSGDRRTRPKSSHGISPNPSGSNYQKRKKIKK